MANTFNGMTADNVAQEGISTLEKALVPMSGFTLDLSSDIMEQGTTVSTRIVPAATAATDLVDDESNSYAAVIDNQTTNAVQVTLDPHPVTGFAFTDAEAQNIAAGVWSDTSRRMVRSHIRGIAEDILDSVFALVTNANYGAAGAVVTAANFDSDDVADLRNAAITAGLDPEDMVMVLNPDYYAALLKDNAIADYSASQSDALRSGQLPRLSGFRVIEAPTLPSNSENLTGFVASSDAIAIAMRGVDTQDRSQFLSYQILQDDSVGSVLTYSALWTPTYRRVEHVFEALYGVKKANGSALLRITSA
jgi:hypothetical protein